jgi:CheY-like chemotaxis protein
VDDDKNIRAILTAVFQQSGIKIYEACDGLEALKEAQRLQPALILLDIAMPGMNGQEVLVRLRENEKTQNIPVIIITAMSDQTKHTDDEWAHKMEVEGFISKPFKPDIVLQKVSAILEKQ